MSTEYSIDYIYDLISKMSEELNSIRGVVNSLSESIKDMDKRQGELSQKVDSIITMLTTGRGQTDLGNVLREIAYIETTLLAYRDQLNKVRDQLNDMLTQLNKTMGELNDTKAMIFDVVNNLRNLLANYQSRLEELSITMTELSITLSSRLRDLEDEIKALRDSMLISKGR